MLLTALTLVETPKFNDKFELSKVKLLADLERQSKAAQQMVDGKPSELSDRQKWYYKVHGQMYFKLKVSNKLVVLGMDGKKELTAILIGPDKKAPEIIKQVIDAAKAGELDDQIKSIIESKAKK